MFASYANRVFFKSAAAVPPTFWLVELASYRFPTILWLLFSYLYSLLWTQRQEKVFREEEAITTKRIQGCQPLSQPCPTQW